MTKIQYQALNLRRDTLAQISKANEIIAAYAAQGYQLTLRQLYYQFVSRDLIANNDREYKKLGETISNGRLAGLVDWDAIVDRTRNLRRLGHWSDPGQIISGAANSYRIDKWANQPFRVEAWVEKDALVGVLERVCNLLDVPYFACRGYVSQSEMWAAAERLRWYVQDGQKCIILHLGDHDPSGKDMTRDIVDRMQMFGARLKVERLALNFDQIQEYNPPPNPAKISDSRADAYIAEFGAESWELDALEPAVISNLIESSALQFRDEDLWDAAVAQEQEGRDLLQKAAGRWTSISQELKAS